MISTNKTKELIICFNKKVNAEEIPQLCINGSNIYRVTTFKLLGVFVSSYLSWNCYVTYLLRKVAKRSTVLTIYFEPVYLHLTLALFLNMNVLFGILVLPKIV